MEIKRRSICFPHLHDNTSRFSQHVLFCIPHVSACHDLRRSTPMTRSPRRHVRGADIRAGKGVRPYLSARLLTVNAKASVFKTRLGERESVCDWVGAAGRMCSKSGDGRGWEWRQTTHHLIMLECATTLCIFLVALVIGVVFVHTHTNTVRRRPSGCGNEDDNLTGKEGGK